MGGMVKGKGGEWEEQTDGVMQVLRTICLKCKWRVYSAYPSKALINEVTQTVLRCFIQHRYQQHYRSFDNIPFIYYSHLQRPH